MKYFIISIIHWQIVCNAMYYINDSRDTNEKSLKINKTRNILISFLRKSHYVIIT